MLASSSSVMEGFIGRGGVAWRRIEGHCEVFSWKFIEKVNLVVYRVGGNRGKVL